MIFVVQWMPLLAEIKWRYSFSATTSNKEGESKREYVDIFTTYEYIYIEYEYIYDALAFLE